MFTKQAKPQNITLGRFNIGQFGFAKFDKATSFAKQPEVATNFTKQTKLTTSFTKQPK